MTLIVMGPVGEWLSPRSADATEADVEALVNVCAAGANAMREAYPPAAVIASGFTHPLSSWTDTGLQSDSMAYLEAVEPDLVLPSPSDILQGSHHLLAMARDIECPVLSSDLQMIEPPETETAYLSRWAPLPSADDPMLTLLSITDPAALDLSLSLSRQVAVSTEIRARAQGEAERLPMLTISHSPNVSADLEIPPLAGHQAALFHLSAVSSGAPVATSRVVTLFSPDALPIQTQPACATLTVGEPIRSSLLETSVRQRVPFDSYTELQRPAAHLGNLPPHAVNDVLVSYDLNSEGVTTHRAFQVSADPGVPGHLMTVIVVTDLTSGLPELIWLHPPTVGRGPSHMPEIIDRLAAENGLGGLPEAPPGDLTGAEFQYEMVHEALAAAEAVSGSLGELP
ncbi:hypothetical protein JXA47_05520 [Candidatus Sumerlaeota bacterium]|nr:hypothetical protein [Candidatus Sumerlaeota bacterium]